MEGVPICIWLNSMADRWSYLFVSIGLKKGKLENILAPAGELASTSFENYFLACLPWWGIKNSYIQRDKRANMETYP
jgi:hypothetical protein